MGGAVQEVAAAAQRAGHRLGGRALGLDPPALLALALVAAGYPVALVHPAGVSWDIGSVSLIKGGPSSEGAKKFVDWVLGRDPIQLVVDLNFEGSLRADVSLPLGATPLEKLDLVDYKLEWAAQNRARILKQWGELFKK